jgi:hypothetical protein
MKDQNSKNVYILNLSTIHALLPISKVLDNFAQLYYDYGSQWLYFEFLRKFYSKVWVIFKYLAMSGSINDYKLGKINSEPFIQQLQTIFSFLPNDQSKELLTKAWDSLIVWNEESIKKLAYLTERLKKEGTKCYLITNSNQLHIKKIKFDIQNATQGEREWQWEKEKVENNTFQVSGNVALMTSYENEIFKSDGLIKNLVQQLLEKEAYRDKKITLISQYPADLDCAARLNINKEQPKDFFFSHLENDLNIEASSSSMGSETDNLLMSRTSKSSGFFSGSDKPPHADPTSSSSCQTNDETRRKQSLESRRSSSSAR